MCIPSGSTLPRPAFTNTDEDAGPYFCEALVLGSAPETGHTDVTIHRLCVQGKDEISIGRGQQYPDVEAVVVGLVYDLLAGSRVGGGEGPARSGCAPPRPSTG
ncbi:UbiD family decarboxylase domain-containing protein [Streptomyces sp. NPDC050421]|uniref:UbiD family decarboxylase domain-containing protein n=1 Tax=unclassified Streptomyces TaxID=2593676 RepID=UPI0037BB21C7